MAKQYKGSLSLDWYNKQKAILLKEEGVPAGRGDIPAPVINWVNKDGALFYEIDEEEGKGVKPYWVDRSDLRVKETRPLIFQKAYKAVPKQKQGMLAGTEVGYVVVENSEDDPSIANTLIRGDNLLALNSLKKIFDQKPEDEKPKCIYIDPPFNIGAAFEHYDDNLAQSEWLSMIRDRLVILKQCLRSDGIIFVHIDDSESFYLKVLMDEIFGKEAYLTTFYIQVRYEGKTLKEDMMFNKLIEQIHCYKNLDVVNINQPQKEYDYAKYKWKITVVGQPSVKKIGGRAVEVFKDGDYQIVEIEPCKDGLKEIWASGAILDGNSSGRFFRDYLQGRVPADGLGVLYKVPDIGEDGLGYRYFTGPKRANATKGKYYQGVPTKVQDENVQRTQPISNFMDLAANVGNCRHEGGVEFRSGKKPEILIEKLLELATDKGDVILDCFGGSGTTLSVAHKMGRQWIGVEIGKQADTHIVKRLKHVLDGADQTGASKSVNWQGGGSFKYYHLGPSIIQQDEQGRGDFRWELGRVFIEESLLNSYDFVKMEAKTVVNSKLFSDGQEPVVGVLEQGNKRMVGVVTLDAPDEKRELMGLEEILGLYRGLREEFSPESIMIFTNRGIEIAEDARPVDLEVVKVPHAIFAELEK